MISTIRKFGTVRLRFRLKTDGTTKTLIASTLPFVEGTWNHFVATYAGVDMRLFLNGQEVGSVPVTGVIPSAPTVPFWIGATL